jgi:hypothetical protein
LQELQINHILPKEMLSHPGEVDVIKHDLTHNLAAIFPEVYDEIGHAFDGQYVTSLQLPIGV